MVALPFVVGAFVDPLLGFVLKLDGLLLILGHFDLLAAGLFVVNRSLLAGSSLLACETVLGLSMELLLRGPFNFKELLPGEELFQGLLCCLGYRGGNGGCRSGGKGGFCGRSDESAGNKAGANGDVEAALGGWAELQVSINESAGVLPYVCGDAIGKWHGCGQKSAGRRRSLVEKDRVGFHDLDGFLT